MSSAVGLPSRRQVLIGASVGIAAAMLPMSTKSSATAPVVAYDSLQRFIRLMPGGNGVIYAVQSDGALQWYRNVGWANGAATWANGGQSLTIGTGWQIFNQILVDSNGQMLAFRPDGMCAWYQRITSSATTGAGSWAKGSGTIIGRGFNRFPRLFGGFDGVVYGIDAGGDLYRYRYGNGTWASNGVGRRIGSDWNDYTHLFADPSGVVFGIRQGSHLYWWRYLGGDNGGGWANNGRAIGLGGRWYEFENLSLFSNAGGTIYGVNIHSGPSPGPDNALTWFRVSNSQVIDRTGTASWAPNSRAVVSSRFTVCSAAALQGYVLDRSVMTGGSVRPAFSTTLGPISLSVTCLTAPNSPTMWGPATVPGALQTLPNDYRSAGCGWTPATSIPVAGTWPSGVYAVEGACFGGWTHPIPFVVRPRNPTAPIAFLLPSNTYNAYNGWGGHNQYTTGQHGVQRTLTFHRPSDQNQIVPTGVINHTLYSDLLLLRWMTSQGIAYDCYDDSDLSPGSSWLNHYSALVLGSHPEYWSGQMRQKLVAYLAAGGRLISTGGNALFEQVTLSPDGNALTFRTPTGARNTFRSNGLPEEQVLGVSHFKTYMTFAPYRVLLNHPVFAGTGLAPGSHFGASGYNGAASGWEVDRRRGLPGEATDAEVIAVGENPTGGAEMIFRHTPAGGWVFAASSIAFNAAVPTDPIMAKILANVLAMGATPRTPAAARHAQAPVQPAPKTPSPPDVPADRP